LLTGTRQAAHHDKIFQVLETHFPDVATTQPELLAHHATEAGLHGQAVGYWQRTTERALQRSAYSEAIGHGTKGLEGNATLPDTPEQRQQELALLVSLGTALVVSNQASPEAARTYARALDLCRQIGDTAQLAPGLGTGRPRHSRRV
jgi:predicted ATPase